MFSCLDVARSCAKEYETAVGNAGKASPNRTSLEGDKSHGAYSLFTRRLGFARLRVREMTLQALGWFAADIHMLYASGFLLVKKRTSVGGVTIVFGSVQRKWGGWGGNYRWTKYWAAGRLKRPKHCPYNLIN
uniref:Uncharacterized protein n=1 Tax=Solanum lycopersicum TaxID=4081 RepID=A0A3Q7IE95_SOLLC